MIWCGPENHRRDNSESSARRLSSPVMTRMTAGDARSGLGRSPLAREAHRSLPDQENYNPWHDGVGKLLRPLNLTAVRRRFFSGDWLYVLRRADEVEEGRKKEDGFLFSFLFGRFLKSNVVACTISFVCTKHKNR